MKKFVLGVFVFMCLGMFVDCASAAELKYGYVDVEKVFNDYSVTKENDEKLKSEGREKADERDGMVEGIKKLREEAELLSEGARKEKEAVIEEKLKELRDFDEKTKTELRNKRDFLLKNIFNEIRDAIEARGKKDGYTFIFNDRALLYKADSYDMTSVITEDLNAKARKE
ncbi:MAG: OmpH family outer membrane protein [Chlamydiota bacterium]|nr:OmpH family outer membrane protein [Chlamydiota bacterium]